MKAFSTLAAALVIAGAVYFFSSTNPNQKLIYDNSGGSGNSEATLIISDDFIFSTFGSKEEYFLYFDTKSSAYQIYDPANDVIYRKTGAKFDDYVVLSHSLTGKGEKVTHDLHENDNRVIAYQYSLLSNLLSKKHSRLYKELYSFYGAPSMAGGVVVASNFQIKGGVKFTSDLESYSATKSEEVVKRWT